MVLYVERIDTTADVVFWCGHREFDEYHKSTIGPDDQIVLMVTGAVIVACQDCFLNLANVVLSSATYLGGGTGAITFWCGDREWIDYVGQPVAGDRTIVIKNTAEAYLVACPECAERFALRTASKAIRLRFEEYENLEEMIENS